MLVLPNMKRRNVDEINYAKRTPKQVIGVGTDFAQTPAFITSEIVNIFKI